ncbi:MAG: VOC family protein, partial [Deltaproteobacteria bacterium]|nr:VOC family protein [Deltaproteobacteria bacterium]
GSIIFLLHEASYQARSPEEHGGVDHFCLTFTDPEFREILERIEAMGVRLEGGVVPRTGATGRSDSQYILDPDGNQIEVKTGL